jgi:hypothetical protein
LFTGLKPGANEKCANNYEISGLGITVRYKYTASVFGCLIHAALIRYLFFYPSSDQFAYVIWMLMGAWLPWPVVLWKFSVTREYPCS